MDKQDSLPHRIHRLYGQLNVLSRTPLAAVYDVRIYICITNIQAQTTSTELVGIGSTSIASITESEVHRHRFALKTT